MLTEDLNICLMFEIRTKMIIIYGCWREDGCETHSNSALNQNRNQEKTSVKAVECAKFTNFKELCQHEPLKNVRPFDQNLGKKC